MREPKGSLTAAQYEIMAAVWGAPVDGITVADIWQAIAATRSISRTTVLSQVDRLEKRRWLTRLPEAGIARYRAALSKQDASQQLAAGFVSDFFQGSAVEMLTALLGSNAHELTKKDLERLRKLFDKTPKTGEETP